jgi:hypothetical protein
VVVIEELIPRMAAHMSGALQVGMEVMEVNEKAVRGLTVAQVQAVMAGSRGSIVSLTVRRHPEEGRTKILLKRGAWGPEHSVVDLEPHDMLDEGSWPDLRDPDSLLLERARLVVF